METITLKAAPRTALGRRAKRVRGEGSIPAVVYGREVPAKSISVSGVEFSRVYKAAGESTLLDLSMDGALPMKVLIQEVALDPVSGHPVHVDFHAVSMTEKIHTRIPLKFVGIAPAVKEVGGIIVKQFDHVEVDALASALVHEIEVDLTPLARIDDVIRFRDLRVPTGITLKHDPEEIVVSVAEVKEEEVAPAPAATPEAVEVVGTKGKKEEGAAEAAAAEPKAGEKKKEEKKGK
jgi:large subunit ribosomal protein L25